MLWLINVIYNKDVYFKKHFCLPGTDGTGSNNISTERQTLYTMQSLICFYTFATSLLPDIARWQLNANGLRKSVGDGSYSMLTVIISNKVHSLGDPNRRSSRCNTEMTPHLYYFINRRYRKWNKTAVREGEIKWTMIWWGSSNDKRVNSPQKHRAPECTSRQPEPGR